MAVSAFLPAQKKKYAVHRMRLAIVAVMAIFVTLYWASVLHEIGKNEDEALANAEKAATFSAKAAAEAVSATIDWLDTCLRMAASAVLQGGNALEFYGSVINSGLPDELVYQLFYIDKDGFLAYSSLGPSPRNYLGDRQYFMDLAADNALTLVVNPPVLGRLTNKWSIQVARAVRDKGEFKGVVSIAVSPEVWREKLTQFAVGAHDVVSLFSPDGTYLLRSQDSAEHYGQHVPADRPFLSSPSTTSGTYFRPGPRDGIHRIYAWTRLPSGQVVTSGVAIDDALAQTRDLNRLIIRQNLVATFALLLATLLIDRYLRKSEVEALLTSEREYRQRVILSAMAEGVAIVSPAGEVIFHNEGFERNLPLPHEKICRSGDNQDWNLIDIGGNPLSIDDYPSVVTARTGQGFDNITLGIQEAEGEICWLNVNTRPLYGSDGALYAAVLTLSDISAQREAERALRESEERYRTVVASLAEGIVLQDAFGAVIACNAAAERILGMTQAEMMARYPADPGWFTIFADGTKVKTEEHPAMVTLRTGQRQDGVLLGVYKPDCSLSWIEINTAPLWEGGAERPVAVVSSFLDVTGRKKFEDELNRSNAELEQFAYAVSHDLRQPLRMVSSYMQLVERHLGPKLDDDLRDFIGFAKNGAKRMDQMLIALLEYSRVGRIGQPMAWIESRQALDEALRFLAPSLEESGANVSVSGEWPRIFASADEVERLFQNLVGNAVKYRRPGEETKIRIWTERDGGQWKFAIEDNGIGIASNQMGRLFKVFQRLHANDQYEGSGVGLALCRKIVERHGGRIWVESEGEGSGSRFIFTLPANVEGDKRAMAA